MTEPQKLKFIDSVHEQRECNRKMIPIKGAWVELGHFERVIERFDVQERWKCLDQGMVEKGDDSTLFVELKLLDHKAAEEKAKIIAKRILAKHGRTLIDSLRTVLIRGLYDRNSEISEETEKLKNYVKYAGDREKTDNYKRLENAKMSMKADLENVEELKKEIAQLETSLGEKA